MRDNRVTRLPEEALRYAAIGWHVFPLQPRGKHPLIPKDQGGSGCHDATTDPAIITDWWTRQPLANIGIACGPSRLVVLDIDGEEGGNWLRWLLDENPEPWPEHPFSLTRTGGHVIFRAPPGVEIFNRQGFPAPKLDIRGAGGYIVAPPSIHPTGHVYSWEPGKSPWDLDPPPIPPWMLRMLVRAPEAPQAPLQRHKASVPGSRYGAVALENACQRIASAPNGQQQATLTAESYGIGRLVGAGVIPAATARGALIDAGLAMPNHGRRHWSLHEIAKHVDRKLQQGESAPRERRAA